MSGATRRLAAGVLLAGVVLGAHAEDVKPVSFKNDLLPILSSMCVFCHVTGAENGGLNLGRREAYKSPMAQSSEAPMARVTPKDPAKSYLLHKLDGTQVAAGGSGNRMPMTDPPREIDAAQKALFVRWIEEGAPDN